jgi:hypothetical protein
VAALAGEVERYHARKEALAEERLGHYRTRAARFGDLSVAFESIPAGFPPFGRSLYRGLPDDACQVAHWGYLFSGRVRFTFLDGTTLDVGPGEAYHAPAGHVWECIEDAETVEFSPGDALEAHMQVVAANLARLAAQARQAKHAPQAGRG